MENKYIDVETQGAVGIIKLSRDSVLNALNEEMLSEIAHQLGVFDADPSVRVVLLKGSDKAFVAGIDVFELSQKLPKSNFILKNYYKSFELIEDFTKPLIAVISGYALGIGLELALCCDIIFASDSARFGQPELSLGVIPGFGGTQKLCQTIGKAKTFDMVLTGRAMTAQEAYNNGLISRIIPLNDLESTSLNEAKKIAEMPRIAVMMAKETISNPQKRLLEKGIDLENKNLQSCLSSPDFSESLNAFAEKRQPNRQNP